MLFFFSKVRDKTITSMIFLSLKCICHCVLYLRKPHRHIVLALYQYYFISYGESGTLKIFLKNNFVIRIVLFYSLTFAVRDQPRHVTLYRSLFWQYINKSNKKYRYKITINLVLVENRCYYLLISCIRAFRLSIWQDSALSTSQM